MTTHFFPCPLLSQTFAGLEGRPGRTTGASPGCRHPQSSQGVTASCYETDYSEQHVVKLVWNTCSAQPQELGRSFIVCSTQDLQNICACPLSHVHVVRFTSLVCSSQPPMDATISTCSIQSWNVFPLSAVSSLAYWWQLSYRCEHVAALDNALFGSQTTEPTPHRLLSVGPLHCTWSQQFKYLCEPLLATLQGAPTTLIIPPPTFGSSCWVQCTLVQFAVVRTSLWPFGISPWIVWSLLNALFTPPPGPGVLQSHCPTPQRPLPCSEPCTSGLISPPPPLQGVQTARKIFLSPFVHPPMPLPLAGLFDDDCFELGVTASLGEPCPAVFEEALVGSFSLHRFLSFLPHCRSMYYWSRYCILVRPPNYPYCSQVCFVNPTTINQNHHFAHQWVFSCTCSSRAFQI